MLFIVITILLILASVMFSYAVWLERRNYSVFNYRIKLLDDIHHAAQVDIALDRDWKWRYDEFNTVTYKQMLNSLKSLDSFYPDKSFTEW